MIRSLVSAAALGIAALAAGGQAQASGAVLPGFTGTTECSNNTADVDGNPCQVAGSTASFAPSPFAVVQASVSGAPGEGNHLGAAFLTYFYTIDGPNNGPIAIDITGSFLTTADQPNTNGFASLVDTEGHQICATIGQSGCGGVAHQTATLVEMETPGQVYSIHLEAVAGEGGVFGGSAFASADPFIGIDLLDLNPELYTIRLSDGVANGLPSPAPEPAAWALMLLGFGVAGAAMRGRRRVAS